MGLTSSWEFVQLWSRSGRRSSPGSCGDVLTQAEKDILLSVADRKPKDQLLEEYQRKFGMVLACISNTIDFCISTPLMILKWKIQAFRAPDQISCVLTWHNCRSPIGWIFAHQITGAAIVQFTRGSICSIRGGSRILLSAILSAPFYSLAFYSSLQEMIFQFYHVSWAPNLLWMMFRGGYYNRLFALTVLYAGAVNVIECTANDHYTKVAKEGRGMKDMYFPVLLGGFLASSVIFSGTIAEAWLSRAHVMYLEEFLWHTANASPNFCILATHNVLPYRHAYSVSFASLALKGILLLVTRRMYVSFKANFESPADQRLTAT